MTIFDYIQELRAGEAARLKQVQKDCLPHFVYQYEELPERKRNLLPGRARFEAAVDCLNALFDKGVRLTGVQMRLKNGILMTACERIFGPELIYNYDYLATHGITEIYTVMYVLFPRRGGKSTTQTVVISAFVITQPDGNYVGLSLFARQGMDWLELVAMYTSLLKDDERFGYRIEKHDSRQKLVIVPNALQTMNGVFVYPGGQGGNYNNLRGIGKQLSGLIIDECEFYPVKGLEVVLPLIINGAFLVMMSSVGGVSTRLGARRLLGAKYDNGSLICKLYNWHKACDACTRKGRAAKCRCNAQPQPYQNAVDVAKVSALMAALQTGAGDRELNNQEDTPTVVPLFMNQDLDILRDRRMDIVFDKAIPRVYIGVDPGTHAHSQTALVGTVPYMLDGQLKQVVISVDFFQSALNLTDVIAQRIQDHIMAIQERIYGCQNSAFVVNIENNLNFGAPNVTQYFEQHPMRLANHVQFIRETQKTANPSLEGQPVIRAGANTNTKTKPLMVDKLYRIMRARGLRVHRHWVQAFMNDQPDHLENKKGIDTLVNQLNSIVCDTHRVDPNHRNALIKRPSIIYRPESGQDLDDGFMSLLVSIDGQRRLLEEVNMQRVR